MARRTATAAAAWALALALALALVAAAPSKGGASKGGDDEPQTGGYLARLLGSSSTAGVAFFNAVTMIIATELGASLLLQAGGRGAVGGGMAVPRRRLAR